MNFHRPVVVLAILLLCGFALLGAPAQNYHLLHKYTFGAAPGGREYFDYLTFDPQSNRLFLSHGTEVLVVDAGSGKELGKISGLQRSHGVAIVNELNRGFITDGEAGKVIIFDLKTLKTMAEVAAAPDADGILYDPASKNIFTFNGDSHSSTVIDPAAGKVVATIDLGGAPEFAVADGRGTIYNNLEDKSEVVAIDARSHEVKSRWPIAPAGAPAPIAIDREHHRLFVAGRKPQMLVVLNADDGKVIQSFPISAGADASRFDAKTGMIFVSTRDGFVHIFHQDSPDQYSAAGQVKTELGAKTMEYDPKTGHIFVDTADFKPGVPTAQRPHPNPAPVPGTFHLLVYEK